jgi:hypothetical protein
MKETRWLRCRDQRSGWSAEDALQNFRTVTKNLLISGLIQNNKTQLSVI